MPFNEQLADRIAEQLLSRKINFEEKRMFGGLCFMVDDKMCMGIVKDDMMARVNPEHEEQLLSNDGVRPMDFTKRPMRGYLYIDASVYHDDDVLGFWIDQCLEFNPLAKASKKRTKKE